MKTLPPVSQILFGFVVATLSSPCAAQSVDGSEPAWGPVVDGLRMGISPVSPGAVISQWAEFNVTLQNVGDKDTMLNLGTMLANGKVQWPRALLLSVTDPNGNARELHFFDKRYPAIVGRLDDMIVPLRTGAAYILRLSLEQYCSPNTTELGVRLAPGRYQITAQFEGKGANHVCLDMAGIALMNFWKGTLKSNMLNFEVAEKPKSK